MQKTTAQSQQESQKNKNVTSVVLKTMLQKKNTRRFNVAHPKQQNIYQITSPTTFNLHTDKCNFV